jgi:5-bromo-4-chloroindolyl phosphate hydrolysis protein
LKERIAKLLTVKSIVTLVLTGVFSFLAVRGTITGQEFLTIFTVIISFYFGTQATKENRESEGK